MIRTIYSDIQQLQCDDEKEDIDDDSDDNEDDIEEENDDDEDSQSIIINTYEDFMKNSPIHKIIITNKTTQEGYVKFKNNGWKKIWNKEDDNDDAEILSLWLKNNKSDDCFINDKYICINI